MRTTQGDKIFAIIRQHDGAANAITAPQICRELGWRKSRERTVRQIIADEAAFWEGWPVCAIPGQGYFVAESIEELMSYDNWLADLVDRSSDKLKAFRAALKKMGIRLPEHHRRAA
jgi:hypothetical protein